MKALELATQELERDYGELVTRAAATVSRAFDPGNVVEGRLTTESGVAVPTTNRVAQSTLYFTPYLGNKISLYDGAGWKLYAFSEISLTLSGLTIATNYDVFVYDNVGTLTLSLLAWASDTARATALLKQDGVWVQTGAVTRRYLGTIRASSATTTEDSETKRFVWNLQNQVLRTLYVGESTDSWSYATDTWRATNSNTANRVEYVVGQTINTVFARCMLIALSSSGRADFISSGIGVDSTSVNSAQIRGSGTADTMAKQAWGFYVGQPGLGYHYLQWIERSDAVGITLFGDNGSANYQSGLMGELRG